jgi:hypothetical protein
LRIQNTGKCELLKKTISLFVFIALSAAFAVFLSGCVPADDVSSAGSGTGTETSLQDSDTSTELAAQSPIIETETAEPRAVGVDISGGDYYGNYHRMEDAEDGANLLNNESLSFITITPDTLIPKYYGELGETVFPRALIRGLNIFEINSSRPKEIDFGGINGLDALKKAVALAFNFENYYDSLVCYSYYSLFSDSGYKSDTVAELTDETGWNTMRDYTGQKVLYLRFYNTAYGLRVMDSWYKQGLWFESDGKTNVVADAAYNHPDEGKFDGYGYITNYARLSEFEPVDDRLIKAMSLLDALKIADSTRTTNRNLSKAGLVYACVPERFGDDYYHLCWELTTKYTTYYINCATGEKWYNTNSED